MIRVYKILFVIMILFASDLFGGEIEFKGNDDFSSAWILENIDISSDDSIIVRQIEELYKSSGYYNIRVMFDTENDQKPVINIVEGSLSLINAIELINIDKALFEKINLIKESYIGSAASRENIDNFGNDILFYLADNGIPFARGEWEYFDFCDSINICLGFKILSGPKSTISTISFSGIKRTKPGIIFKNINLSVGQTYSESKISDAEQSIESMKYLEISAPFSVGSRSDGDSSEILFYLNELPSTRFDGIGGFINNDNRTDFYGNISLEFGDILGTGRLFKIAWRKKDRFSSNLRIGYLEPGFPSDNLDLALEFYQEDKDSLFLKSGGRVGVLSRINKRLRGNVWFSLERIESENNSFVPSSNIKAVTLEFDYDNTDNRRNPRRGYEFNSDIAYRYRSNKEVGFETDLPTQLTTLGFGANYYLKTGENLISVAGFDSWGIISENENLSADEYRYIGGFGSLRGYMEDRFPAYRYIVGTIEQRVLTGKYSRAFLFADFGLIANNSQSDNYDFYPGYGLGIQLPTVPGTFKLEIAWGKTGFPENLVLNFGFLSDF